MVNQDINNIIFDYKYGDRKYFKSIFKKNIEEINKLKKLYNEDLLLYREESEFLNILGKEENILECSFINTLHNCDWILKETDKYYIYFDN